MTLGLNLAFNFKISFLKMELSMGTMALIEFLMAQNH